MSLGNIVCLCVVSQIVDKSFKLIEVLNTVVADFILDNVLDSVKNEVDS